MKLLSVHNEISDVFESGRHENIEKYALVHLSGTAAAVYGGEEPIGYSDQNGHHANDIPQRRPNLDGQPHPQEQVLRVDDKRQ